MWTGPPLREMRALGETLANTAEEPGSTSRGLTLRPGFSNPQFRFRDVCGGYHRNRERDARTVSQSHDLTLSLLTLGLFVLVIDAIVLWFSSKLVPGFSVTGFTPAFIAALILALIQMLLSYLAPKMG